MAKKERMGMSKDMFKKRAHHVPTYVLSMHQNVALLSSTAYFVLIC